MGYFFVKIQEAKNRNNPKRPVTNVFRRLNYKNGDEYIIGIKAYLAPRAGFEIAP